LWGIVGKGFKVIVILNPLKEVMILGRENKYPT